MSNPIKLFIVEGVVRDYRFVYEMSSCFFESGRFQAKIINLPASQNIYMLYKLLKEDNFESDIVELLRDTVSSAQEILNGVTRQDVDEVYLMFDYDIHQNNLPKDYSQSPDDVLFEMMNAFNDETNNGKLYLSYPMVEALYDYRVSMCESFSGCLVSIDEIADYKTIVGNRNPQAFVRFDIDRWKEVIPIFILRIKCLFELDNIDFGTYRDTVNPLSILDKETSIKNNEGRVFVLSAFPEFILDYFGENFWKSFVKLKKYNYEDCPKGV